MVLLLHNLFDLMNNFEVHAPNIVSYQFVNDFLCQTHAVIM